MPNISFMVFRQKTGCKQYNFDSSEDLDKWVKRKPYKDELLKILVFDDNQLGSTIIANGRDVERML